MNQVMHKRPRLRIEDPGLVLLVIVRRFKVDREKRTERNQFLLAKQADVLVHTEMRPVKEVVQHVLHQFYAVQNDSNAPRPQ